MEFRELSLSDMKQVREWRNKVPEALRTPYLLTDEMQEDFYKNTICNRNAKARFWKICKDVNSTGAVHFVGMCGLENIEWENGCAEISIIMNPHFQGKGYGMEAIEKLLDKGFNQMNLKTIYGECYECNSAINFWKKVIRKFGATFTYLPNRKFWNGEYYSSLYFSIDEEDFNVTDNT